MGIFQRFRRSGRDPRDAFAEEVLAQLRAVGVRSAQYQRDRFGIEYRSAEGADPAWMNLANLYAECVQDPQGRTERIRRFVTTFAELPPVPLDWDTVRPLLRPVLRGSSFGQPADTGRPVPLRRPVLPFLDEFVVVDQPTAMAYVTEAVRRPWGVSEEEVFAAARANLTSLSELPADTPEGPLLLRFVDDGDAYWVSHLLRDGWLARLAEVVGGRPVAFAPNATALLVTDDEPDALVKLFNLVGEEYGDSPRPLSPVAYTVDAAGLLTPYEAPAGHPVGPVAARAERLLAGREYEWQRTAHGEDDLAECVVVERPDGSAFTTATWRRGRPTLLPRVDFVALAGDGPSPLLVPWAALVEADAVHEVVEHRPPRYRTPQWPDPTALGYLRDHAVTP
jgi:hypothetical protein